MKKLSQIRFNIQGILFPFTEMDDLLRTARRQQGHLQQKRFTTWRLHGINRQAERHACFTKKNMRAGESRSDSS